MNSSTEIIIPSFERPDLGVHHSPGKSLEKIHHFTEGVKVSRGGLMLSFWRLILSLWRLVLYFWRLFYICGGLFYPSGGYLIFVEAYTP